MMATAAISEPRSPDFDSVCSDRTRMLVRMREVAGLALWISILTALVATIVSVTLVSMWWLLACAVAAFAVAAMVDSWLYPKAKASFLFDAMAAGMPRKAARQLWFETMEE